MPCNTQTWDELFVPFYHDDLTPITINWEQWFSDRSAHYYAVSVDNLTQGESVCDSYELSALRTSAIVGARLLNADNRRRLLACIFCPSRTHLFRNIKAGQKATLFIAAEWYEEDMKNNTEHLSKIVHEEVHDGYKVLVDGRFQYGQISSDVGGGRFLVYHDKDRKPFQVSVREGGPPGGGGFL